MVDGVVYAPCKISIDSRQGAEKKTQTDKTPTNTTDKSNKRAKTSTAKTETNTAKEKTEDTSRKYGTNAWLTVSLTEGKNREIRKLMASIGLDVARLIRLSYGPFQLGSLKCGEVKEVPQKVLKEQLGKVFEIK